VTRQKPLPAHVRGGAFRVSQTAFHQSSAGRLRAADLQRPFHGVRSSGLDLGALIDHCHAYEPLLRPGEAFSHETAAHLYGLPLPSEVPQRPGVPKSTDGPPPGTAAPSQPEPPKLHVTAPDGIERARSKGVAGHELTGPIPIRFHLGLPLVAPARLWCQLATRLTLRDLVAVGDAIVTGARTGRKREAALATVADLQDAVRWWGRRRGARRLARALPLVRVGAESRPETHLRLLLVDAGLPEPLVNHPTVLLDGAVRHPDLAYVQWRIVIEYQGDDHRLNRRVWQEDVRRKRAFERAGWQVVEVTSDDIFVDSTSLVARLHELIATP
jgi:hypothetical protein